MVWLAGQGILEEARFKIVEQMFGKESYRQTYAQYTNRGSLCLTYSRIIYWRKFTEEKKWAKLFGQDI